MIKVVAPASGVEIDTGAGTRIRLAPNEARELPRGFAEQAIAQGAAMEPSIEALTEAQDLLDTVEDEGDELLEALRELVRRGDPKDFTKDGTPRAASVRKLVKRRVSVEDILAAWDVVIDDDPD